MLSSDLPLAAALASAIGVVGYAVEDDRDLPRASASQSLQFSDLNLSISLSIFDRASLRSFLSPT